MPVQKLFQLAEVVILTTRRELQRHWTQKTLENATILVEKKPRINILTQKKKKRRKEYV